LTMDSRDSRATTCIITPAYGMEKTCHYDPGSISLCVPVSQESIQNRCIGASSGTELRSCTIWLVQSGWKHPCHPQHFLESLLPHSKLLLGTTKQAQDGATGTKETVACTPLVLCAIRAWWQLGSAPWHRQNMQQHLQMQLLDASDLPFERDSNRPYQSLQWILIDLYMPA
jgi:hypothetical protein